MVDMKDGTTFRIPSFSALQNAQPKSKSLHSESMLAGLPWPGVDPFSDYLDRLLYIQFFLPRLLCPYEERLGGFDDGGKWTCSLRSLLPQSPKCIVYSFGSRLEFDFENSFAKFIDCEIHVFDPTPSLQDRVKQITLPKNIQFHSLALTGEEIVLKIDIENSEWKKMIPTEATTFWHRHLVGQLYIELHMFESQRRMWDFYMLMRTFEGMGMKLYHSESNVFQSMCWEFAFLDPDFRHSETGKSQMELLNIPYTEKQVQAAHESDIAYRDYFWNLVQGQTNSYFHKAPHYFNNVEATFHCVHRTILVDPNDRKALYMFLCLDHLPKSGIKFVRLSLPPKRSAVERALLEPDPSAVISTFAVDSSKSDLWQTLGELPLADVVKLDLHSTRLIQDSAEFIAWLEKHRPPIVQLEVHMPVNSQDDKTSFLMIMNWARKLDKTDYEIYFKEVTWPDIQFSNRDGLQWNETVHASVSLIHSKHR
ncbi:methyltransferase domain-containing protein [Cladochytrium replicatum]|nr:methyltransferase domain-containing protein [Cladochytrium replicatum]